MLVKRNTRTCVLSVALVLSAGFARAASETPARRSTDRLPRVLIIGDSISIGYTQPVQEMLKGEADVSRIPVNGADTWKGLKELDGWLGDGRWDVIHFNWGLHDLKHVRGKTLDLTAPRVSTLEQYAKNLETLVVHLKATGATLIWASTTPIPEGAAGRIAGQEVEFNGAALAIMRKHGVLVNDLHAAVLPELARYQQPKNVHFTQEGSRFLASKVAAEIRAVLGGGAKSPVAAARGVLQRLLPKHAERFAMETIPAENGLDVFEIESRDGRIVLRGNNGVSLCSALNWYLKYHCFCHVSWSGVQLDVPEPLPPVETKVRRVSPHRYRYWFNYCAFSYSLAFWDWAQWERMIDWMALHGVNMPLAVTGQEATWQAVGRRFGLSDEQVAAFLPGPAYLPFGWMGCLDGWGGPLPQSWIDSHLDLQRKILARERELGMTPLLQGFTGHVPVGLKDRFPQAKFKQLPKWCGFPGTTFVDPQDPLFVEVGKAFVEEQTRQYGTDHYYASDTFIEMSPPSNDPAFLAEMGRAVYAAMAAADPKATWVMQGWIFFNNPQFWQPPQAKALFGAVPDDRLLLIEMSWDSWTKTEAFYGKPWIWCVIQNFGDTVAMQGKLKKILEDVGTAMTSPQRGRMCGIGVIMEGLDYNPVVFDLMTDLIWRTEMPKLEEWVSGYVHRRYGAAPASMNEAWALLLETAYGGRPGPDSVVCLRPNLAGQRTKKKKPSREFYDNGKLTEAWRLFVSCAGELGDRDAYRFDLVNLTRQVLANAAQEDFTEMIEAYEAKDRPAVAAAGARLLGAVKDMDELLATRREFMLGPWLADAKRWATNDAERKLYEWNARNQITLWGPPDSWLHDYARKQWSGLLAGFHAKRWERFAQRLDEALAAGKPLDAEAFDKEMQAFEDAWTRGTEPYPTEPTGNAVAVARRLWAKYGSSAN